MVVEPQRSKMRRHTSSPTDVTAPLLHDDKATPTEPPSNRLDPAPPAICYLAAVAYVYLCDQGIEHCRRLQKTGRTDVGELMIEWCILLVVYSIETLKNLEMLKLFGLNFYSLSQIKKQRIQYKELF